MRASVASEHSRLHIFIMEKNVIQTRSSDFSRGDAFDTNYDVYRYIDLYCFCVRQIVIPYFNLYQFFYHVRVSVCAPQKLRNFVVLVIVLSLEETFIYVFCMTSRYHIFLRI